MDDIFRDTLRFVGVVLFLLFALCAVAHLAGCRFADRARLASDAVSYDGALSRCNEEGKKAQSMAVYERCAREADRTHGFVTIDAGGQ